MDLYLKILEINSIYTEYRIKRILQYNYIKSELMHKMKIRDFMIYRPCNKYIFGDHRDLTSIE